MAIGIIRFPGTNCDRDVYKAIELAGGEAEYIWWNKEDLTDYDGIVIPGGFSYGDYLRAGAIASNTPVVEGVKALVKEEKPVLGICNGAQILGDIPIAHAEGRFYTKDIDLMKDQDQIVLQFAEKNPNGSMEAITGVCDESGLVLAMMPHPERATTKLLGSDDGLEFFKGMLDSI